MTIIQLAHEHWFIAFCFGWMAFGLARTLWVRLTRTIMVIARGWPPAHLDADGDWKPDASKEPVVHTVKVKVDKGSHASWCDSQTKMLTANPPIPAACNCKVQLANNGNSPIAWGYQPKGGSTGVGP